MPARSGSPILTSSEPKAAMQSLERGLQILRALNDHGPATVLELSRNTRVSRGSIYRILETLEQAGYIRSRDDTRGFELAPLVRSLSDGFNEEAWIRQIAVPILRELQQEIVWPACLARLQDRWVYVRETTRHQSPLTIDRGKVGLRLPALSSASGRAHLAFCPEKERFELLENILSQAGRGTGDRMHPNIDRMLALTHRKGYGSRFAGYMPATGSIAVPILHKARVLGCINITFIASVLHPEMAAERYLASMQKAARRIEEDLIKSLQD